MGCSIWIYCAILFGIVGISILWPARNARKKEQALATWPKENGTIISCGMVKRDQPLDGKRKSNLLYEVNVRYQFRAGGQMRFGNTAMLNQQMYSESEATRLVEKYPAGKAVKISYSLEDPNVSFLEIAPSLSQRNVNLGFVLIALAIFLALASFILG